MEISRRYIHGSLTNLKRRDDLDALKELLKHLEVWEKKSAEYAGLEYLLQKASFDTNIDGMSHLDAFVEKGKLIRLTEFFRTLITLGSMAPRRVNTQDVRFINTMTVQELRKLANPHAKKLRLLKEKMDIHRSPIVIPKIDFSKTTYLAGVIEPKEISNAPEYQVVVEVYITLVHMVLSSRYQ